MNNRIMMRIAFALFFVSLTFLIAALQIPHIGEGAPEWHTVKRPGIPANTASGGSTVKHPDKELILYKNVCVNGVCRRVEIKTQAFWIETLSCYCYFDDYGRLCAVPEIR